MKTKNILMIAAIGAISCTFVNEASAQSVGNRKSEPMVMVAPQTDVATPSQAAKTQINGLLEMVKESNDNMDAFTAKAISYIKTDISAAQSGTDMANDTEAKKVTAKKTLLSKAETISKNAKANPKASKTELIKVLEAYLATF